MVRPNPVLSVNVFKGFRVESSLRASIASLSCPLAGIRPLPMGSECLPLEITGDGCLQTEVEVLVDSTFPFTVRPTAGLDLPADSGLFGKVVSKFGGVSSEKSGRAIDCGGARTRGTGELGRDTEATFRPFGMVARPLEAKGPEAGDRDGAGLRRVGVDGLDEDRTAGELKFVGTCGLEVGVEGRELTDGLSLSEEDVLGEARGLEGVEGLEAVERAVGVDGLVIDELRLVGVDGLI